MLQRIKRTDTQIIFPLVIMKLKQIVVFIGCCHTAAAFVPHVDGRVIVQQKLAFDDFSSDTDGDVIIPAPRRVFFEDVMKGSLGLFFFSTLASAPAHASGGATAGGAYLLSGKD